MTILLGLTGSVATTLAPKLVSELGACGTVEVVVTECAKFFFRAADIGAQIWTDADEWRGERYVKDQSVLHIELRQRADLLVIAPCTADMLAALATGRAHNLLTSVVRAWDRDKPLIIAPAMNTFMWQHPATEEHLATLRRWYGHKLVIVPPIAKRLACGDQGIGALAQLDTIVQAVQTALA